MEINISNTSVLKFRKVEDLKDDKVQCNNIIYYDVDCHECIFNLYGYTLDYLRNDDRLRN